MHALIRPTASALLAAVAALAHADSGDDAMLKLATTSGCLACHHVDPGATGPDGMAPIGPAWRDVARKYQGVPGAAQSLTRTVMGGSNPYASHWKGQVSGLAMPPNAVAIRETDAAALVQWILLLAPAK